MELEVEILLECFSVKINGITYWTDKPKLAYMSLSHMLLSVEVTQEQILLPVNLKYILIS